LERIFSDIKIVFYNAALNYGYAIIRAAIARTLCSYGFLPAFGLFHRNELNSFNLADDLIEPYRPLLDAHVLRHYPQERQENEMDGVRDLTSQDKANLVMFLHQDITLTTHKGLDGACTVLAGIEATVISLSQVVQGSIKFPEENDSLVMPKIASLAKDVFLVESGELPS